MFQKILLSSCYNDSSIFSIYPDLIVTSSKSNYVLFTSFITDINNARSIASLFKKDIFSLDRYYQIDNIHHQVFTEKVDNDLVHIIFKYHRNLLKGNNYSEIYPIFIKDEDENSIHNYNIEKEETIPQVYIDAVIDGIKKHTNIPIIDEWGRYITKKLLKLDAFSLTNARNFNPTPSMNYGFTRVIVLTIISSQIEKIITEGLENKEISIEGCNNVSEKFLSVTGLDSYQNNFGNILSENTKKKFQPKFDPNKDNINEKINDFYNICQYYLPSIKSYPVQKNVIQSVVNHFKTEQNVLISGQTGSGKTLMAIGSVIASAKKKNYTALAMVPSGLVKRWTDAIKNVVPNAIIREITDIKGLMQAEQEIRAATRIAPLWVVLSENTAKANYEKRPAVIWSESKNAYVCPNCGNVITVFHNNDFFGQRIQRRENANDLDFLTQNDDNFFCCHINNAENGCHKKMWTAASKDNSNDWVKLNKCGWILKQRIPAVKNQLEHVMKNLYRHAPKTLRATYSKILKSINEYEVKGVIERYPMRYNIARYVRKYMRNLFDFGVFDEVHTFAGDSQQGAAFGNICSSVKKAIFLTGTLSNGYASGLFHILFRTQTKKMLEAGFNYNSVNDFADKYGVKDLMTIRRGTGTGDTFSATKTHKKTVYKPGISPTLYADFLMNNIVAVSKKDIKENLCQYSEIPVPVEMDQELLEAYSYIMSSNLQKLNKKDIRALILKATMFLDQPFGLEVYNNKNQILELSPDIIRPKEQELVNLCQKAKDNNEKVLIYCEYTSRLDIANRLAQILNDNNISAISMSSSIDKNARQSWLEEKAKEDIDAVILNPALVGTGLNLLDYTTIIFYQIGTKLTTIRQASQRSNRINQEKPVTVYFMYYDDTVQSTTLALISQKLKAAKAIEGDFSETALQAMSEDTDIMTKLVSSIVKNENIKVDISNFNNEENLNTDDTEKTIEEDKTKDKFIKPIFLNRHIINLNYEENFCNNLIA